MKQERRTMCVKPVRDDKTEAIQRSADKGIKPYCEVWFLEYTTHAWSPGLEYQLKGIGVPRMPGDLRGLDRFLVINSFPVDPS
jgi:hypothetical protein